MAFALTGARVFDGEVFHDDMAVVVDGRRITERLVRSDIAAIHAQTKSAWRYFGAGLY